MIEILYRGGWGIGRVVHDVRMTMRQDHEVPSVERHSRNHPFDIKPAVSLGNHMEAGSVPVCHAKTPRHTHLGAAIEGTLNMHRPQHIGQDIFRPEMRELLHRMPSRRRDRPHKPIHMHDAYHILLLIRSCVSQPERLAKKFGRSDIVRALLGSYNCANARMIYKEE